MPKFKTKKNVEKNRRTAWRMYYSETEAHFRSHLQHYQDIKDFEKRLEGANREAVIPTHIINELKDLIAKTKKKVSCPVCLDIIKGEDLVITNCGHKYCKTCHDKLLTCALCRKPLKKRSA